MIYDLQKASILKRISAWLLDFILICILATGFGALLSVIVKFDDDYEQIVAYEKRYEELGIESIAISQEKADLLTGEAKAYYEETTGEVRRLVSICVNKAFIMISLGLFFAYLITEFVIPLCLKNGQTVGKKVFSVGVMQISGVKLKPISLFVRSMLGKYAIETMVPLSILLIFFFIRPEGLLFILLVALGIFQIVLFFATKTRSFIHDALASSVTVDMQSQMIFNTAEEMIAYKEETSRKEADKAEYK